MLRNRPIFGLLTAAVTALLIPASAGAQWTDLGLGGRQVTRLQVRHGCLFACTNGGLYRKASDTSDSSWVLLGFGGQRVYDVLPVSPETLIAARQISATGADTVALWRTTDGGASWVAFQNGLGAAGSVGLRMVRALLAPEGTTGVMLAATENGIARSIDGGSTWTVVYSGARFFFLAQGIATLWAGGQGATFGPVLRRSKDGGQTWLFCFITGNTNSSESVAFDPSNANVAYLGLDAGLRRTTDDGVSWTSITLPLDVSARAIRNRAFAPLRLYAAGVVSGVGDALFKSDDGAASWTPILLPPPGSAFKWTILVRSGAAVDTVFMGLENGVLRYLENELVGVGSPAKMRRLVLRAFPNPLRDRTSITYAVPRPSRVSLMILDSEGRNVATLFDGYVAAGSHRVTWIPRGARSGAYFCRLRTADGESAAKLLLIR